MVGTPTDVTDAVLLDTGAVVALVNSQLSGDVLAHSINTPLNTEKSYVRCVRRYAAFLKSPQPKPLLSTEELEVEINGWMKEWREHPSDGTDMDGLSPAAVFQRCTRPGDFLRFPKQNLPSILPSIAP